MCENFSFSHICVQCQELFLTPSLYKRKITKNIEVISFYKYSEIKTLLHTKHTDIGYYIYNILAKNSLQQFAKNFKHSEKVASIAIDDNPKDTYSHTAILNKHLESKAIQPHYQKLRATNTTSYSGKTREFRLNNPRDFSFQDFQEESIILVDDIITTGSTLKEAVAIMERNNKNVLFCLTLANAGKN